MIIPRWKLEYCEVALSTPVHGIAAEEWEEAARKVMLVLRTDQQPERIAEFGYILLHSSSTGVRSVMRCIIEALRNSVTIRECAERPPAPAESVMLAEVLMRTPEGWNPSDFLCSTGEMLLAWET